MRSSERAAAALACLTPRDRALLRMLYDLRYMTCAQAHRTCYAGLALPSVRARLGELRRRDLVHRLRGGAFTDRRTFWGLASLGRAAAFALEAAENGRGVGDPCAAPPRPAAAAALQLDHMLGTNELLCDLCEVRRAGRIPPFRWLAARRSVIDLGHTHLVPDAVVLVAGPDGWWVYYVERDRGTMPPQAIRDKLERYALLFKMARSQLDDPAWSPRADAWVLFACDHMPRARRVASLAAEVRLERVWAGRADECAAGLAASLAGTASPRTYPVVPAWAAGSLAMPDDKISFEEEPT